MTDVDDPPVAVDDTATVAEDAPATAIDVLANDTDVDGGPKTIARSTQPANGTVVDHRRRHRPDLHSRTRTTATTGAADRHVHLHPQRRLTATVR